MNEIGFYRVDLTYTDENDYTEHNDVCLVPAISASEVMNKVEAYYGKAIDHIDIRLIAWNDCDVLSIKDDLAFDWGSFAETVEKMNFLHEKGKEND